MYYTEYLPRLNSISVVVEHNDPFKKIVDIVLNSKNQVLIRFQDIEVPINLPVPVGQNDQIRIVNVNHAADCLQLTISLSTLISNDISEKTESFMDFSSANLKQKWSCKDLKDKTPKVNNTNDFKLSCLFCSHKIIDSKKYDKFFDMPSEWWSEMMEFWHCHKPAEGNQKHLNRNYDGVLKPNDNDVIIGSYYFLLNQSPQTEASKQDIQCVSCKHNLGILDNKIQKLFKWNLTLKYGDTTELFPSYIYIYNLIVDKINLSAIRKFKVKSESKQDYMFIWVMNVGVDVSTEHFVLNNSLKVFYYYNNLNFISNDDDESIESLIVHDSVLKDFQNQLNEFNKVLPNSKKSITLKVGEEVKLFNISFIAGR